MLEEAFLRVPAADLRIPAKPGQHSEGCRAIIPVDAGPVVKRSVDCDVCR